MIREDSQHCKTGRGNLGDPLLHYIESKETGRTILNVPPDSQLEDQLSGMREIHRETKMLFQL